MGSVCLADLQTESLEGAADLVLDVEGLALQGPAVGQKKPQLLTLETLHMDKAEPARAHDLGDATSIVAVGLVAHRPQGRLHLSGLDADRRQAFGAQTVMQPRR
jgi:hypothetical protein